MKKLIALRGSVIGCNSNKLYELIYLNDIIYVFITSSYDGSLQIDKIRKDDYHIGGNIFKAVIKNPWQFKYHHYEDFAGVWRAAMLPNHEFESDKYYSHLIQLNSESDKMYNKYVDLSEKLVTFCNELKL